MHINTLSYKYFIVLILVVVSLVFFLILTKPIKQAPVLEIPPLQVEIAELEKQDLYPELELTGYLQPARKVKLHFELSGQLTDRLVEAGRRVEPEELLLQMEAGDYLDIVKEAQARFSQEKAAIKRDKQLLNYVITNRKLQEEEVARMKELGQKSLASQSKYGETIQNLLRLQVEEEKLNFSVETGSARLQLRQAALQQAQRDIERTRLVAPFAGVVNAVYVQKGDYVTPAQTALEIVQVSDMDLYLEVGSVAATVLHRGQGVEVESMGEQRQGKIIAIQLDPDPETFTYSIRIRISGEGLLSGNLARAIIPLAEIQGAITVPVSAISRKEKIASVFVVRDSVVIRKRVTLGRRLGNQQVVTDGLKEGLVIVVKDVAMLNDGLRVMTQQTP